MINLLDSYQKSLKRLEEILKKKTKHLLLPFHWWPKIIPLLKQRLKDFSPESLNFWLKFFSQAPAVKTILVKNKQLAQQQLEACLQVLERSNWQLETLQKALLELVDGQKNWSRSQFFKHLRLAITGRKISLPLIESMEILGREECLKRIRALKKSF